MASAVFGYPRGEGRMVPPDWHATPGFRALTRGLADPVRVDAALDALRAVFSTEWVDGLSEQARVLHPFEHWFATGGGAAQLVRLGRCLQLVDIPGPLVERLRTSEQFESAEAEVRAAALFVALGAHIDWIQPNRIEPTPEFWARFGEETVVVEVKQLRDGDLDLAYARVDTAFTDGVTRGVAEALRGVTDEPSTHTVFRPPMEGLVALAETKPLDVLQARRLGHQFGQRLGTFIASQPEPGRYELGDDLEVTVEPRKGPRQHGWEADCIGPTAAIYATRVLRLVRKAAEQIASVAEEGFVVLERRSPRRWPRGTIEGLRDALQADDRLSCIGAVVLREDTPGVSRTAENVTVLEGPAWRALPSVARASFPSCEACGSRHCTIDLLAWSPEHSSAWIREPVVDSSTADGIRIARATPAAVKLRQALAQMQVAYSLARANFKARHPGASAPEQQEAFRAWMRRDD